MNIKCPKCGRDVIVTPEPAGFRCPECNTLLMEEETGEGFLLVGVKKEPEPDRKRTLLVHDPILEDYAKWQLGAIFGILLGLFLALMVVTPLLKQAFTPRPFAPRGPSEWLWVGLWCGLSVLLVVGGLVVFFKARASSRDYEHQFDEEPPFPETR
jgi:ribosomal protein S27E